MSIIIPANSAVGGGYDVDNSLRFEWADAGNLNKTLGTATNRKKFTISTWVKRSDLYTNGASRSNYVIAAGTSANTNVDELYFRFDTIDFSAYESSSTKFQLRSDALFRDVAAWYHLVIAFDSTQGTSSNRIKIYVNNVQITDWDIETYPSQNLEPLFNKNVQHMIGRVLDGAKYYGGYMSEFVFIDGQQLDPTSFGEFDEDSGTWKPISVSGLTFGNNGFYLEFKDSSALGADTSGNSNNFTVVNIAANDQMPDTCTNNWCTINSLNAVNSTNLAEGNLQYSAPGGGVAQYVGTMGMSTGSWYYEFRPRSGTVDYQIGIAEAPATPPGGNDYQRWTYKNNGRLEFVGSSTAGWGSTYTNGDVIGISMDVDNGTFKAYKNGTLSGTKTGLDTDITWLPHFVGYGGPTVDVNFGQDSTFAGATTAGGNTDADGYGNFKYAVPTDHYALNTKNLAEYG